MSLPAECQTDSAAPEAEVLEPEVLVGEVVVLERIVVVALLETTEVADDAADADVIVELAVEPAADVDAEIVGRQLIEQRATIIHVGADQAEAGGQVRTHAAARRGAEQHVRHQRRHVAFAEIELAIASRVFEEVW